MTPFQAKADRLGQGSRHTRRGGGNLAPARNLAHQQLNNAPDIPESGIGALWFRVRLIVSDTLAAGLRPSPLFIRKIHNAHSAISVSSISATRNSENDGDRIAKLQKEFE